MMTYERWKQMDSVGDPQNVWITHANSWTYHTQLNGIHYLLYLYMQSNWYCLYILRNAKSLQEFREMLAPQWSTELFSLLGLRSKTTTTDDIHKMSVKVFNQTGWVAPQESEPRPVFRI